MSDGIRNPISGQSNLQTKGVFDVSVYDDASSMGNTLYGYVPSSIYPPVTSRDDLIPQVGDLMFQLNDASMGCDTPKIVSVFNGLLSTEKSLLEHEQNLTFFGVNMTSPKIMLQDQFGPSQPRPKFMGVYFGTQTIVNNSMEVIEQGQEVIWKLVPKNQMHGVHGRCVACVAPYRVEDFMQMSKDAKRYLQGSVADHSEAVEAYGELLQDLVLAMGNLQPGQVASFTQYAASVRNNNPDKQALLDAVTALENVGGRVAGGMVMESVVQDAHHLSLSRRRNLIGQAKEQAFSGNKFTIFLNRAAA